MSEIKFEINGEKILGDKCYGISIQKVGQEHCHPRKKHEIRKREYHSLYFILFGCGVLHIDGEKLPLNKGMAFLLYAGEEYEYYPNAQDPWSYVWIDFYGESADLLFAACGMDRKKTYTRLDELSEVTSLLKQLLEAYDASALQKMACSAYFMLLLIQLINNAHKLSDPNMRYASKFKRIRDILIYINNNYKMDLSPEKIAAANYISVSRLMALFSELVEMSPTSYVNRFRVSSACEMLRQSDIKIETISQLVGIGDQKYFSRVFHKWTGTSPREYRKACGADDPFLWLKEKNIDYR